MARRNNKRRITPVTKLILFLLISTPLIYLGISYATGQDGVGHIKSMLGFNEKTDKEIKSYIPTNSISTEERDQIYQQIEDMKMQLRKKNQTISELEDRIRVLEASTDN
jgi:hypothetical protein